MQAERLPAQGAYLLRTGYSTELVTTENRGLSLPLSQRQSTYCLGVLSPPCPDPLGLRPALPRSTLLPHQTWGPIESQSGQYFRNNRKDSSACTPRIFFLGTSSPRPGNDFRRLEQIDKEGHHGQRDC